MGKNYDYFSHLLSSFFINKIFVIVLPFIQDLFAKNYRHECENYTASVTFAFFGTSIKPVMECDSDND